MSVRSAGGAEPRPAGRDSGAYWPGQPCRRQSRRAHSSPATRARARCRDPRSPGAVRLMLLSSQASPRSIPRARSVAACITPESGAAPPLSQSPHPCLAPPRAPPPGPSPGTCNRRARTQGAQCMKHDGPGAALHQHARRTASQINDLLPRAAALVGMPDFKQRIAGAHEAAGRMQLKLQIGVVGQDRRGAAPAHRMPAPRGRCCIPRRPTPIRATSEK